MGRCGEHTADPGVPTYCFYSTGIETTPQRYDYYGELSGEISWDVHTGPGDATCTKASLEVCKHWPSTVSAIDFGAVKHTDMVNHPDVLAALRNALPEMPPGAPPPPPAPPGAPPPPHLPPDMPASIWPPPPPDYIESVIADMQKAGKAICPDLSDEEIKQGVLYLTLGPYGDVCPPAVSCLLQHDASPSQASRECASKGYIASPGCIAGFYMNLTESIALPCPDGHFCPKNYMCAVPCRFRPRNIERHVRTCVDVFRPPSLSAAGLPHAPRAGMTACAPCGPPAGSGEKAVSADRDTGHTAFQRL